jgi:hypothetical protein
MTASVLSWLLGAVVAGACLVVVGLRGKRVGGQPVCRGCGFDLSDGVEATGTCPECGAGLKRAKAVRRGRRRKRPIVIVAGALAILAPMATLGAYGYALFTGVNLDLHKPLAVLEWELNRAGAARSRMIAEELLVRMGRKETPRAEFDRIVELALERQGDRSRRWCPEFGEIISEADMALRLDKDRGERFRRQATVLDVAARERVRVGEMLPVVVALGESRVGKSTDLMTGVDLTGASIGGKAITIPKNLVSSYAADSGHIAVFYHGGGAMMQMYGGWGAGGTELKLPEEIGPGKHVLKLKFKMESGSARSGFLVAGIRGRKPGSGSLSELECWVPVEIVEEKTVAFETPSDELRQMMEFRLEPIRVMRSVGQNHYGTAGTTIHFNIADLPVGVDFDVELRNGDSTWNAGRLTSGRGLLHYPQQEIYYFIGGGGSERVLYATGKVTGEKVDVVLKPNAAAAAKTVDLVRIYGAEIVYKDVEVTKPVARR